VVWLGTGDVGLVTCRRVGSRLVAGCALLPDVCVAVGAWMLMVIVGSPWASCVSLAQASGLVVDPCWLWAVIECALLPPLL
jgi:hypothetical protein